MVFQPPDMVLRSVNATLVWAVTYHRGGAWAAYSTQREFVGPNFAFGIRFRHFGTEGLVLVTQLHYSLHLLPMPSALLEPGAIPSNQSCR